MSNLIHDTTPKSDQITKLLSSSDSFGHELKIGALLKDLPNASVKHGGTYTDPSEQKPRQFDYRVLLEDGNREIRMAIECKSFSKNSPIVISGILRPDSEANHSIIVTRLDIDKLDRKFTSHYDTHAFSGQSSYYQSRFFTGKCIHKIKPIKSQSTPFELTGDGDIYTTLNQSIASCYDLCQNGTGYIHELHPFELHTAIIPIVVIPDDCLWTLAYNEAGEIISDASSTNYCEYFVGKNIKLRPNMAGGATAVLTITHLHIYTLSGFREFVSQLKRGGEPTRDKSTKDISLWGRMFPDVARNDMHRIKKTRIY